MEDEMEAQSGLSNSTGFRGFVLGKNSRARNALELPYNYTTEIWRFPPARGNQVFLKLDRLAECSKDALETERVYYQAQLHLCLYYSLAQKGNTADFDEIYKLARESNYWEPFIADNYSLGTIGEHAIFELAVDSVTIFHICPHLSESVDFPNFTQKVVDDCPLLRATEFIYFRLIRHICALMEAYLELLGGKSRAMMSLSEAKHILTRTLTDQASKTTTVSPLGVPPVIPQFPALPQSLVVEETEEDNVTPILKESIETAIGDEEEIENVFNIKQKHIQQRKRWSLQLETYLCFGCDIELGNELTVLLKALHKALDPEKVYQDRPYKCIHKRAYKLTLAARLLVRLVVLSLFGGEQTRFLKWTNVVSNAHSEFKYFSGSG